NETDFRRSVGEVVGNMGAFPKVDRAAEEHEEVRQERRARRRKMNVKDALDFAHRRFARRIQKNHVEGHDEPDERDCEMDRRRKDFLHRNVRCPGSVVRTPADGSVLTPCSSWIISRPGGVLHHGQRTTDNRPRTHSSSTYSNSRNETTVKIMLTPATRTTPATMSLDAAPRRASDVASTDRINTQKATGNCSTGSITSRILGLAAMAPKIVPRAA